MYLIGFPFLSIQRKVISINCSFQMIERLFNCAISSVLTLILLILNENAERLLVLNQLSACLNWRFFTDEIAKLCFR